MNRILSVFGNLFVPAKDWWGNAYAPPTTTWGESYESLLAKETKRDLAFRTWASNVIAGLQRLGYVVQATWSEPRGSGALCPDTNITVGIESIIAGEAMLLSLGQYDSLTRDRRDPMQWVVSGLQYFARYNAAHKGK